MRQKTKRTHVDEPRESLAEAVRRVKGRGKLPKRVEGKRGAAKISSKTFDRPNVGKG
jgi:hypothetical protein